MLLDPAQAADARRLGDLHLEIASPARTSSPISSNLTSGRGQSSKRAGRLPKRKSPACSNPSASSREPSGSRTGRTAKGYYRALFEDAFARYLPPPE